MDFTPNAAFTRQFAHTNEVYGAVLNGADNVGEVFRRIAPRRTGAMVRTSHAEMIHGRNGWYCQYVVPVENERGTQYGKFVEFGTRYMQAQHNLLHSLEIVDREQS